MNTYDLLCLKQPNFSTAWKLMQSHTRDLSYPEIGNTNFKGILWTFKRQLALKYKYDVEFLLFT